MTEKKKTETKKDTKNVRVFKVIHDFKDKKDGNKVYVVGDKYTSNNDERIKELTTKQNDIGERLIKEKK